jgi:SAM-dependent methyltransferase
VTFFTIPDTSSRNNVDLPQPCSSNGAVSPPNPRAPHAASGDKAKARALLAAVRTLQAVEQAQRSATPDERRVLMGFPGFGPVALGIFPDPVTGQYKDAGWQALGEELRTLLAPEDYASARRTTFTAFYTSPVVIQAMHAALAHLGVPFDATVLESGCGIGNFLAYAPAGMRFIGVELDRLSGRIARVLHPGHDIRIKHFRDTRLPEDSIDAVLGNVPFADLRLDYHGIRLALHDFFLAKSLDALKPGGVLALVTSHYTLDKQHPGLRTHLAQQADFLGAIRLPAEAFAQEGTRVVTDILCLRKRAAGEEARHADPVWLETAPLVIEDVAIRVNRYLLQHPAMVLGTWSRHDRLYAAEGYPLRATGDLASQLAAALQRLPQSVYTAYPTAPAHPTSPPPALPPLEPHLTEGSFFVTASKALMQIQQGAAVSVTHGTTPLQADGSLLGRRLAALIALRDHARCVLQSQNEGWPEGQRQEARRALNRVYDRFVATYGPIVRRDSSHHILA